MDLSAFHFLRPAWLLTVLPALWLWWRLLKHQQPLGNWGRVMEARFARRFLHDAPAPQRWPVHGLLTLWTLSAIALAGPAWIQKPVPAHKVRTGTVIVFDLSLSMLAQDIKPSRLQRARFKVEDLIKRHPDQRFGLVAYAGSAHVITPLAEDSATLLNLLPALNPMIMPELGSRPDLAMRAAHRLFRNAGVRRGHIIWITDDLDHETALESFFQRHDYTLAILAVGTPEGAPIPLPEGNYLKDHTDRTVIARLNWQRLRAFASKTGATLTPLTLDDADIRRLKPPFNAPEVDDRTQPVSQWLDMGPWLAVIIAMLSALLFRRGWVFMLMPFLLLPTPERAYAQEKTLSDWRDIFRTPDQQGYVQWQKKHYDRACDLFEDPAWKGVACASAGRIREAVHAFEQLHPKTARDWYNLGTLQARAGRIEAARIALEKALALQPDFPQARDNLRWVRQRQQSPASAQLTSTPSSHRRRADQLAQKPAQNAPENAQTPAKTAKTAQKPGQSGHSTGAKKTDPQNFRGTPVRKTEDGRQRTEGRRQRAENGERKTESQNRKAPGTGRPATTVPASRLSAPQPNPKPDHEHSDSWIRLIPDNPGLYLQRKFEYQLRQHPPRRQEDKTW